MADIAGPFEPDRAHVYGLAERRDQLRRFMNACERVSRLFAEGRWSGADEYAHLAEIARDCLHYPGDPERLKAVATALPPKPSWMDPRMPD